MAKSLGERTYGVDIVKLTDAMLAKKRWKDLKAAEGYDVSRGVLVSTTDVRRSNSAAMYLALTSYAKNGDVVTDRATAEPLTRQLAELFKRQGYQENYVNGNFDDYVAIGIGKTPMAFIPLEGDRCDGQERRDQPGPDREERGLGRSGPAAARQGSGRHGDRRSGGAVAGRVGMTSTAAATDDLAGRLARGYTGVIYDVLRARGHAQCILPPQIVPLDRAMVAAGPVFSERGQPDAGVSPRDIVGAWLPVAYDEPISSAR